MSETQIPNKRVNLRWTGTGMQYVGAGESGASILIDAASGSEIAPGPMDTLLLSLAGCMAVDVQTILERSRVPLRAMEVEVEGERAPTPPKRYTRIRLVYRLSGPEDEHQAKLDRAIDLSRRKFCSVLHSLRPDIDLEIETRRI